MLFKDLKNGFPVFIYNRETIEFIQARVVGDVQPPHIDNNFRSGQPLNTSLVVDVPIEMNGTSRVYTFKDNTEIGYTGNLVIATDRSQVLREVEAATIESEDHIKKTPFHEARLEKLKKLSADLNPAIKERQAIEDRFSAIEKANNASAEKINNIETMLTNFINEFKK